MLNVQFEGHGDEAFPFWPNKLRNDRLSAGSFPHVWEFWHVSTETMFAVDAENP
jgi:hypothetical protein